MTPLRVLAAGSLRPVWPALVAAWGSPVNTDFGPAGLLRERILAGESCDLFASANTAHAEHLRQCGLAQQTGRFAANSLCLTVKRDRVRPGEDWLTVLTRPDLRLATSTPHSDPSGDYTWQLFAAIEQRQHGMGRLLENKARCLVGGPQSLIVPPGELAARWLLAQDHADMFIGYTSYAPRLAVCPELHIFTIPPACNIRAEYAWALCQPSAQSLADFLQSPVAQQILSQNGFLPVMA
ncbi:substrate-binding domain-containing protein [Pantoea phytobeneficialis]|uniref:Molybdenum ABC transporter substrate-binding protein n=1 Tax=Pantoea phytobeneficialis TaxID=2052056 RepID=A0AAP9H9T7_9GAMM|nr:substrate-binding domain-containing protein [Pantoea phytobeneficialis]MDO6407153.1 substrate-binding domain-containing protein [Pantoea phytobeneficialis]QGR09126.1 molybdenum ABC transporter substrate-binding protein [Pantoea phytobeneficialis]